MEAFDALLRETMILAAVLCVPVLTIAATVGTAVAIVQAATQVQEQTLTLLPKVLAVGLMVALFGAFGLHACAALFRDAIAAIPALVHGS
ncbi:MAG TPA: flagellar biosynthetic protein FliQ [Candidatus Baltobacteraceae bacterium]|nr:flagellar biosynthetic protein FliQ [Candidatus Baltobacteraceae bacterium]